jgi:hypothetical protein
LSDQTDQQELRDLIERQRVLALVDHYVNTLDKPSSFDEDWARSLFTEDVRLEHEIAVLNVHPGVDPPDPLIAANFLEADAVQTSNGWRFERFAPRTFWRTGLSPALTEGSEK